MHSAERTQSEVKVRRPFLVSQECTAEVARIIGIATREGDWCWSVSTTWPAPEATASSASARMRARPCWSAPASPPAGQVQSISTMREANAAHSRSNWALARNGLSSTMISVWAEDWSSTFLRLPKRVLSDITRCSRTLSIGGFVTWEKFWRKKCASGR